MWLVIILALLILLCCVSVSPEKGKMGFWMVILMIVILPFGVIKELVKKY